VALIGVRLEIAIGTLEDEIAEMLIKEFLTASTLGTS
jgi:hypothetical protein